MTKFEAKINKLCRLFTEAIDIENDLDAYFVVERLLSAYAKNVWWPNVKPILELCEQKLELGQKYHSEKHDVFIEVVIGSINIHHGDSFSTIKIYPLLGKASIWVHEETKKRDAIGMAFSIQYISDALTIMDWSMQYLNEVKEELESMNDIEFGTQQKAGAPV